jgi:putative phosphoribosyl transferase
MSMIKKYQHRQQAGEILAKELWEYADKDNVIVLALPRGGVPVAFEIAKSLHAPLDVFIVRKIGVPGHSELAMGAIAMNGTRVFNESIVSDLNIAPDVINAVIADEELELKRRQRLYRDDKPFPILSDKTVILVDDGIATGATLKVAIAALQKLDAASIIVAVPVADIGIYQQIALLVDKIICPMLVTNLYAVGAWYDDFSQTEDEEVSTLLRLAKHL